MALSGKPPRPPRGRFEQFLDFAPDAIVGVHADGRIALVNARTETLLRYGSDELLAMCARSLIRGSEFPAEISLSSVDGDDGTLAVGAIRDIAERMEAQRTKERLEREIEATRRAEHERGRGQMKAQLNQQRLESSDSSPAASPTTSTTSSR